MGAFETVASEMSKGVLIETLGKAFDQGNRLIKLLDDVLRLGAEINDDLVFIPVEQWRPLIKKIRAEVK